jgi:hypothetical protein
MPWSGPEVRNTMKTMRKSKIQSVGRRMDRRPRTSMARKSMMAFGTIAAIAVLSKMLQGRRIH